MPQPITATSFDRVELLVHPFFALENVRVKGSAGPLKNMTENEMLEDYGHFGLESAWRERIQEIKRDPHAVLILIGPQELEVQTPRRFFFNGLFTKEKLKKFSQNYQEFLAYAKNVLGARMFYLSHTIGGKEQHLANLMWGRKLLPAKEIRINAYGEYLATTQEGKSLAKASEHCVDAISKEAKEFFIPMQKHYWGQEGIKTEVIKLHQTQQEGTRQNLSLGHMEMQMRQSVKEALLKGRIKAKFIRRRLRLGKGFNTPEYARRVNDALKRNGMRRK